MPHAQKYKSGANGSEISFPRILNEVNFLRIGPFYVVIDTKLERKFGIQLNRIKNLENKILDHIFG